ncbi:MAG: acylphosphatase [Rhodocyclales bacterium RIFCSPLOWO2_02_FULL_63_24]|nr:MAG: acylphosphatase [Rhodocyclales bacterium RIFCSPLOWO2_02_FULL_63_24]
MTEVRRLIISGVVQGVGFRYAMLAQARLLGVGGWVRNRRDGSVEAMIAGDAGQIAEMLVWSHLGPAGAAVDDVMVETASGEFSDFELRPTV